MPRNELFTLIICIFIFAVFVGLFTFVIVLLFINNKRIVEGGLDDKKIKSEYLKEYKNQKKNKILSIIGQVISGLLGIFFVSIFALSLVARFTEDGKVGTLPVYQVVKSESMSYKHQENEYLTLEENVDKYGDKLSQQFEMYDIVKTYQLPGEFELELYDIIIYEVNNINVIHRIIEIEEPNENHPDCRYFKLKGDANTSADRFPVLYKQMKGIYKGEKMEYVGSFILFFQSPAGFLCISLILFYVIATPIVEKKLEDIKYQRLKKIGYIQKVKSIFNARSHIDPENQKKTKKKGNDK